MPSSSEGLSSRSLIAATKSRAEFSGVGSAKGAKGTDVEYVMRSDCDMLVKSGEDISINAPKGGFEDIRIGAIWDNIKVQRDGVMGSWFGMKRKMNIDLDLGCLYELNDGTRGAIQAFGDFYGQHDAAPYIHLLGDERTGDTHDYDETIVINGQKWGEIKRLLFYVYIYDGAETWAEVSPEIHVIIPGRAPLIVTLGAKQEELDLCLVAKMDRVRSGMRITNFTRYYPGHSEMDRANGWGLNWGNGQKGRAR